jgi:hypothetical protein
MKEIDHKIVTNMLSGIRKKTFENLSGGSVQRLLSVY